MSLLLKIYWLGEVTYLLIRFNRTKFFHETQRILINMLLIIKINTHHSPEKNNIGKGFSIKMNDRVPSIFVKQLPSVLPTPPFLWEKPEPPLFRIFEKFLPPLWRGIQPFPIVCVYCENLRIVYPKSKVSKNIASKEKLQSFNLCVAKPLKS